MRAPVLAGPILGLPQRLELMGMLSVSYSNCPPDSPYSVWGDYESCRVELESGITCAAITMTDLRQLHTAFPSRHGRARYHSRAVPPPVAVSNSRSSLPTKP